MSLDALNDGEFTSLEQMAAFAAEGARPPERLTVSQAAEKYRYVNNKGSFVGMWQNRMTPYLIEPMDVLNQLRYTGMVFVGPAQCGKTDIYINWHLHTVVCDPADMMLVQTSRVTASDFSKRRIDRLHRDSKEVGARLLPAADADNTFDKRYASGAMITLSWPSINELSGKPIPRLFLTDYDRMDQDVDKNGAPFDLAQARTTTFGRHGMTAAESSPSFPVLDPNWSPMTPHEAPPTEGILALYNRGDRRRWYWPCDRCHNWFEPDFSLIRWPQSDDILEAAEAAWLECPYCRAKYHHDPRGDMPGKHELNRRGTWIRDGQKITQDGEIVGTPARSDIASFWLKGVAAAFKDWRTLVSKQITAEREFERSRSEDALKATVNVDQGMPYLPKSMESDRLPETLKERAVELGKRVVPEGVRFLVAAVDVQKNRFEVQVHGVAEGGDIYIIDRFQIRHSHRKDPDREGQVHFVRPFTFKQDWWLLLSEVMLKRYPLADESGREMAIKLVLSDSGGQGEGTSNAYEFVRWLRRGPEEPPESADDEEKVEYAYWMKLWSPGLHARFALTKGASTPGVPRVKLTYPDSQRKDRHAGARGEIPVLMVNTTILKNMVDSQLGRDKPNTGMIWFPTWLPMDFYKELCVEVKDEKGVWINPKRFRNESWDLLVMCNVGLLEPKHIGIERLDWSNPPSWADEWGANDLVVDPKTGRDPIAGRKKKDYGGALKDLADQLG